jgi:hypothetical protein
MLPSIGRSPSHHPKVPTQTQPVARVDIYVDNFILLAPSQHHQRRVMRTALHLIDEVFQPLERGDPPHRKESSSAKKMLQGDAAWSHHKHLLFGSWDFDTEAMTLNLPPH